MNYLWCLLSQHTGILPTVNFACVSVEYTYKSNTYFEAI